MSLPVLEVLVSSHPGGGPAHVLAFAPRLRARGAFAPLVAGPAGGAAADAFLAADLPLIPIPTDRLAPRATVRLVRLIRERGIRLVHSHGKGAGLHARLAARVAGVPSVHTFHGIHFERYGAPARAVYLALERTLARGTAALVCVSAHERAEAMRLGLARPERVHVIPNGVDVDALVAGALDRAAARARLGLPQEALVVGTVARFDPVKGLPLLAEAAAQVSGARLVVIGDGPDRAALGRAAPSAHLPGEIPDAARLLRAFDVFATASAKEGMPIAVLEAMAIGLPIVASDIPAHREVLGDDYPGLAARDAPALSRALAAVVRDPVRAANLADRNRCRVAHFDVEPMVDRVAELYRRVLL